MTKFHHIGPWKTTVLLMKTRSLKDVTVDSVVRLSFMVFEVSYVILALLYFFMPISF